MRILHFFKTAIPDTTGGIEQFIDQLASGTKQQGIEVDVLSLSKNRQCRPVCEINGYNLHCAPLDFQIASTGFSFSAFRCFRDLAEKADLIHYHFPWPFMDLVHFITAVKKPTVVTYHSDIIRQKFLLNFYKPLQNQFLASVDSIVATSPNYRETSPVLKKFSDKVSVIPIGLNSTHYPEASIERLDYWRTQFGERFFLFVGVLRYYKGLPILIEAAKMAPYPILIVGAGPIELDLKLQAEKAKLKNIYFLGLLSDEDKVALLTLSYAFVFPSHLRSEAFGISLLEGAMFAKPLISCEIGTGTTFINKADETGLVIPPSDPIALSQAMQYLWEHPSEAAVMGRLAKERYEAYFTGEKMVKAYLELYQEVLAKKTLK